MLSLTSTRHQRAVRPRKSPEPEPPEQLRNQSSITTH